jgi:tetratricopeptide (TPR) repeat protein
MKFTVPRVDRFAPRVSRLLAALTLLIATASALQAQSPEWLEHRGTIKMQEQDVDGAILDFSRAIYLNPNYAFAYNNRGSARRRKGDFQGAIADYTKAFQLDPQFAEASYNCGAVRMDVADFDGAISDFGRAIRLAPESWHVYTGFTVDAAYYARGYAYQCKGDFVDGARDFDRAIALKPKKGDPYELRGMGRDILRDFAGAKADYDRARTLGVTGYVDILCFVAAERLKSERFDLKAAMTKWKSQKPWMKSIGLFLTGQLSEERFLAMARTGEPPDLGRQKCEAFYYAAMQRKFSGDDVGARGLLEQCVGVEKASCIESIMAAGELGRTEPAKK